MTIDPVALTTSIAACGSAIVALVAVISSRQATERSYEAKLVILRNQFFSRQKNPEESFQDYSWTPINSEGKENSKLFFVPLRNVGLGVAREVHFRWKFDIPKMIKSANVQFQKKEESIKVREKNGFIVIQSDDKIPFRQFQWDNEKNNYTDFIQPLPNESNYLEIPQSYITLHSIIAHNTLFEPGNFKNPVVPNLFLYVSYLDVSDKKREQLLEIRFNYLYKKRENNETEMLGTITAINRPNNKGCI